MSTSDAVGAPVPDGYDADAVEVLAALARMAGGYTFPVFAGDGAGMSSDGMVLVCWDDRGDFHAPPGVFPPAPVLRLRVYLRTSADPGLDARRGITGVADLAERWGRVRHVSCPTRMPVQTSAAVRSAVATLIAEDLAAHLDSGWAAALARAGHADPGWVGPEA